MTAKTKPKLIRYELQRFVGPRRLVLDGGAVALTSSVAVFLRCPDCRWSFEVIEFEEIAGVMVELNRHSARHHFGSVIEVERPEL